MKIEMRNITKHFGEICSLHDVNLEIASGSIFGLIGSNGSGKSTLLRVMDGIFRPDAGAVTFDGKPIWEDAELKREILYLSDEQYFLPACTLGEMRNFYAEFYPRFDDTVYCRCCDLFGIDERRRISTFSKGMKKQAAVILALAACPSVLLCDETFDGLDPVMRQLFKRLLADAVADRGMTAVIASHNLHEIEDICDHVALLHRSDLIFSHEIDDLRQHIHTVQAVFEGEFDPASLGLEVVRATRRGSMVTLVVRGEQEEIASAIRGAGAQFYELIPLTLEEIFISEMEERGYDYSSLI